MLILNFWWENRKRELNCNYNYYISRTKAVIPSLLLSALLVSSYCAGSKDKHFLLDFWKRYNSSKSLSLSVSLSSPLSSTPLLSSPSPISLSLICFFLSSTLLSALRSLLALFPSPFVSLPLFHFLHFNGKCLNKRK